MASICMSQVNYQRHQIQLMMLQQQQQQQQQQHHQQQQQQISPYQNIGNDNKYQHITAAPTKILGNSNLQNIQSSLGPMMSKKKYTYLNMPYGEQLPSVARRNARERNRVKQVNNGFANLRQHLPQSVINSLSNGGRGASKKLSKVDTLRIAVEYIRGLKDLLDQSDDKEQHFADDASNDGSNCGYSLMDNSEASVSPAPSYSDSDISIGGVNYFQTLKLEESQHQMGSFENCNALDHDDQPDDEELLDYISLWQEQ